MPLLATERCVSGKSHPAGAGCASWGTSLLGSLTMGMVCDGAEPLWGNEWTAEVMSPPEAFLETQRTNTTGTNTFTNVLVQASHGLVVKTVVNIEFDKLRNYFW